MLRAVLWKGRSLYMKKCFLAVIILLSLRCPIRWDLC